VPIVVLTAIRGVRAVAPLKVAISEVPGTPAVQLVPVAQSKFVAPVQIESAALTYKAMGSRRNVVRAPARAERKRCCRAVSDVLFDFGFFMGLEFRICENYADIL
jgi:hypothetical protein